MRVLNTLNKINRKLSCILENTSQIPKKLEQIVIAAEIPIYITGSKSFENQNSLVFERYNLANAKELFIKRTNNNRAYQLG